MTARPHDSDAPSLGLVLVEALVFWLRRQGVFWLMALPIAGLAGAITYILESNRALIDWRHHWGWDFLFALIYAMFLDRWIKEALLEDAYPCEEADALRGSTIAPGFLVFAAALGLMATALALLPHVELSAVLWTATASLFALMLPALAAGEPAALRQAFAWGRPLQAHLFLLIGGAVALWLLADPGVACSRRLSARRTVEGRRRYGRPSADRRSAARLRGLWARHSLSRGVRLAATRAGRSSVPPSVVKGGSQITWTVEGAGAERRAAPALRAARARRD